MAPNPLENFITMDEVKKHDSEEDAWMVIGNFKTQPETGPLVYNVTEYLDEHPGGAEVMMDVAGQDADNMFEDIGHSKAARKTMEKFCIGVLKISGEEKARLAAEVEKKAAASSGGGFAAVPFLIIVLAIAAYFYMQNNQ